MRDYIVTRSYLVNVDYTVVDAHDEDHALQIAEEYADSDEWATELGKVVHTECREAIVYDLD